MAVPTWALVPLRLLLALSFLLAHAHASKQAYVVYMGASDATLDADTLSAGHHELLSSACGSAEGASTALLYSYKHVFNGFAAYMSEAEVASLAEMPEVLSVFPSRLRTLHTTRSWEFLGLERADGSLPQESLWRKAKHGSGVIIGLLDSGIWPESVSFDDKGVGPIPAKWKGECVKGQAFGPENCNRKLIGGKFYLKGYEAHLGPVNASDYLSARDMDGHGTHTASTAGGNFAPDVSCLGQARGTAKGGAPAAHLAEYKVCWAAGCDDSDILAAMDEGVHDGVDVFSLSLGGDPPLPPYYEDAIALAAFHAYHHGIVTVCSAGNAGPAPGSTSNVAPWIITVGASSIDRSFPSDAVLADKLVLRGQSSTNVTLPQRFYPLVSAGDVGLPGHNTSILCMNNTLDRSKVAGKIVACLRGINGRVEKGGIVKEAGGIGMILGNNAASGDELLADPHLLAATMVTASDALALFSYIASSSSPMAEITPATTKLGIKRAPKMASFSSQGPNPLTPDILKPDITAPGLNILAAWTGAASPTGLSFDPRRVKYNIISGTSMSCPHTAGVAALLRAAYPKWSPAAIKSALVTTATQHDNAGDMIQNGSSITATPFNYGGGQIDPNAAADPGLVYDATTRDYALFLCALGYNGSVIQPFTEEKFECPRTVPSVADLNYPSVALSSLHGTRTVTRTVTNVGRWGRATYSVSVQAPSGVEVTIEPTELAFRRKGEQKTFHITFTPTTMTEEYSFGSYTWTDGYHHVRSPIAVQTTHNVTGA